VRSLTSLVRIGTRGSDLARWQAGHVASLLRAAYPGLEIETTIIRTRGDEVIDKPLPEIGGKGVFTAEIERALAAGEIDVAVHSLKDLPTDDPEGLTIGAVPARENVADVLVSRGGKALASLPAGSAVGTGSLRRAAQLLSHRPNLVTLDIRGNVPTRIDKAIDPSGPYDAIILAYAGLARLGRLSAASDTLPLEIMLPAPGQGALGIQCRDDAESRALLDPLNDEPTLLAVTAERSFLAGLGGGCSVPVAAWADQANGQLSLHGRVLAADGTRRIDVTASRKLPAERAGRLQTAREMGHELAQIAMGQGAARLIEAVP
jgi:hydroxymethylbilane synthase